MNEEPADTESPDLKQTLREKVPEILLEIFSVVLAVLLALAVDDWRERRDNAISAQQAREAVLAEIRANHDDLGDNALANGRVLEALSLHLQGEQEAAVEDVAVERATAENPGDRARDPAGAGESQALQVEDEDGEDGMQVEYSVSLLSSAAWSTTQMTLATHHMEFDWVTRISKLYELQALFLARQDELVSYMAILSVDDTDDQQLLSLHHRLRTVVGLEDSLLRQYVVVHPDLEEAGRLVDDMETGTPEPPAGYD